MCINMLGLILMVMVVAVNSEVTAKSHDEINALNSLEYQYRPGCDGWIKPHREVATWLEATETCRNEGAELAAPINSELTAEIKALIRENNYGGQYIIDVTARYVPGIYMSTKGVSLQKMPVRNMIQRLDWEAGACLGMDHHEIRVISCSSRLPYFCYRPHKPEDKLTECGTFDRFYKLNSTTGSCYKHHKNATTWNKAFTTCINEGGYLAIINDEEEATAIQSIIRDSIFNSYIGLRALNAGEWISIHGEPVSTLYENWFDSSDSFNSYNRCAIIIAHSGKMNAIPCDSVRYFVCEKDPKDIRYRFPAE